MYVLGSVTTARQPEVQNIEAREKNDQHYKLQHNWAYRTEVKQGSKSASISKIYPGVIVKIQAPSQFAELPLKEGMFLRRGSQVWSVLTEEEVLQDALQGLKSSQEPSLDDKEYIGDPRVAAIAALTMLGPKAQSAVSTLKEISAKDERKFVKKKIDEAIEAITGETPAK